MSGVVKAVKKHFKRAAKTFKKTWKWVALAVAIYFTAGLAMYAMPATASFAAAMPGIATAASGLGIASGAAAAGAAAGSFSSAAVATGAVGGAAAGAGTAAAAAAIPEVVVTGTAAGAGAGAAAGAAAAAGAGAIAANAGGGASAAPIDVGSTDLSQVNSGQMFGTSGKTAMSQYNAYSQAASQASGAAAKSGMSLTSKLLIASAGTQAVSALIAPKPDEIAEAQAKWRGAFYGVDASGRGPPPPAGGSLLPPPGKSAPQGPPAAGRSLLDPGQDARSRAQQPMMQPPIRSSLANIGGVSPTPQLLPKATDPVGRALLQPQDDEESPFGIGSIV